MTTEAYGCVQDYVQNPRRSEPGCFILDIWLPDQSGTAFQSDLPELDIKTPVIVITRHQDVHICLQAMKADAHDFLMKPVRYNELVNSVFLALSRKTRNEGRAG